MQPDAELVKAVLDGDKQAFGVLVKRYECPVRAVALDVLDDYHLASDVSQDAFITAYDNLAGLQKPAVFGPWLMKITRRCALDFVRRNQKEASREPAVAAAIVNPNGELDEEKRWLLTAVMKLPESERQVIMLRYFGGNSVNYIADILGRSVGTVTKQLSRAHRHLRNILERSER